MKQELEACGCLIRNKQEWNVEPGKHHVNSSGLKIISAADGLGPVAFVVEDQAALVAAAPELLDALEEAESVLRRIGCDVTADMARTAIAKATGGAQ